MTQRYTNKYDISLPMAVWLTRDTYDYNLNPTYISATSLLKPIKQIILERRETNETLPDVSDFIASRMGNAIHDSFEKAWCQSAQSGLEALGYPDSVIEKILVNPEPEQIQEDSICIYFERRSIKEIAGFKVGGKFDMVADGVISDLKTTSVFGYMSGSKDKDHQLQGSIYRWLNPELITSEYINIQYLFTDWSKGSYVQQKDKGYPPLKIVQKKIPLLSLKETEKFISSRLALIKTYIDVKEPSLPECTKEELWQGDSVFKYYKKKGAARSTKNFDSLSEANERFYQDGSVGEVKEIKGIAKACNYCRVYEHCSQKDRLIQEGILIPKD